MGVKPLRRLAFVMVTLALLAPHTPGQSSPAGNFARAYQEFRTGYLSELRRNGFVGSSFYLVRDNRVVAKELYGLADAERGVPVDEETIYGTGPRSPRRCPENLLAPESKIALGVLRLFQ
ncbi:MAG: hypothetical protein ABW250_12915 [Pyrinomonadaceae bacterium]